MSALPRCASIRQQVLDDARYGTGDAHLEPREVPKWITETGDHDIAGEFTEALSDSENKPRERWNLLMSELLELRDSEDMPIRKALELLDLQRSMLTEHCIADAQRFVENQS